MMEKSLKKRLLAFGLILICIGLVLMSTSNLTQEKATLESVASADDAWSISGTFERDDKMVVIFREANDWGTGFFESEEGGVAVLYVYIHIFDPRNSETRFMVTLTSSGGPGYGLFILDILVTETDGLDISSVKDAKTGVIIGIGGTVQYNGLYKVMVDVYPPRQNPPSVLGLYEEKKDARAHPYAFLLPSGAALGVVGTAISLFGLKSEKHRASSKSKKFLIPPPKKRMLQFGLPSRAAVSQRP